MALPKPGFCINYRRDETHVSHWAASDFPTDSRHKGIAAAAAAAVHWIALCAFPSPPLVILQSQ